MLDLLRFAAGVAIDGAEFVAGGAVFLLFDDGGQVGYVIGRSHRDRAHPEAGEGGVVVEKRAVLGVCVEEIKRFRMCGLRALDMAEETAEDGQFEGVEEEGQGGFGGEWVGGCVAVVEGEGSEGFGL